MAAYVDKGAQNTNLGTSLTVPYPASVSSGQFLLVELTVAVAASGALVGLTNNASFTVVHDEYINQGGSQYHYIKAWKRAAGGESGSVTFSWTPSAAFAEGGMHRFSGVSATEDPPFQFSAGSQTNTTTHTAPSVSSTYSNSLMIISGAEDNYSAWSTASGFTEHYDGGAGQFGALQSKQLTATGATGTAALVSAAAGGGQATTMLLFDTTPTGGGGGSTQDLDGDAAAAATATGAMSHGVPLSGAAAGAAASTGALSHGVPLQGAATGQAGASGGLGQGVPLQGAAAGTTAAAAALSVAVPAVDSFGRQPRPGRGPYSLGRYYRPRVAAFTPPAYAYLTGAAVVQASAAGGLSHGVPLQGTAVAVSGASGALRADVMMSGSAVGQAGGSGLLLAPPPSAPILGSGKGTARVWSDGLEPIDAAPEDEGEEVMALVVALALSGVFTCH